MSSTNTVALARTSRADALRMVHIANASHIASCLSMADILAVLYGSILNIDPANPRSPDRDRFLLSKGHGAAIYYAVLSQCGFFSSAWLDGYCQDGQPLGGHVTSHKIPGVEFSTGSLGHAMPVACGMALVGKKEKPCYRVFVLLSDGELDEGSNWESILFAPHHQLDNLTAIVDYNKMQGFGSVTEVLNLESLSDKWRAFHWSVQEVDGHDHVALRDTLNRVPFEPGRPSVVVAHTIKGKGVSFMENRLEWHYKSPSAEQLAAALEELKSSR